MADVAASDGVGHACMVGIFLFIHRWAVNCCCWIFFVVGLVGLIVNALVDFAV
ncbi:hypothetical protein AOQ84DRAFT_355017 [Glonium stellatum]|uniref:Transmembrane protein n=1 Tax=Glonium stellatum TaxID=574774 RepID=A0A8E2JS33_9PEZI|nr:hypothetical protein AOQ84DRAFT_355017 [Glonium stellatum]